MNTRYLTLALPLLLLVACGDGDPAGAPVPTAKVPIASAAADDLSVSLLADGPLATGLCTLYLAVTTTAGAAVLDATIEASAVMAMANGMQHGCPVLGPSTLGSDGLYRLALVFQMASTATDTWSLNLRVRRATGATTDLMLSALHVADGGRSRSFTATQAGGATADYVASLNLLGPAQVGLNDVLVTLHGKQDMWTFPPVDDAVLSLDPQMPSMGHGSPGSVDPVWIGPGIYQGRLSFSMPGDWETTLTVARAGVVLGAPVFRHGF